MNGDTREQTTSRIVVLIDHTGARHSGEGYDAMQALRDAETARPTILGSQIRKESDVPWIDWNDLMRGRERG